MLGKALANEHDTGISTISDIKKNMPLLKQNNKVLPERL